jgi:type IV secretion system protein VirD4
MVSSILRPLLRSVEGRAVPTLFLLDEFAQLGHMEMIEDNYALMRGYGVKLWTIFQDLNQAKILYKDRWESFISNAGIVQAFAPQDMTTRKYLSDLADERMTWIDKESKSSNVTGVNVSGGTSTAPANIKEPLIYPYELGQMQQGQSVLFTARGNVLRSYFPDAAAKGFAGVADMMAEAARNMRP